MNNDGDVPSMVPMHRTSMLGRSSALATTAFLASTWIACSGSAEQATSAPVDGGAALDGNTDASSSASADGGEDEIDASDASTCASCLSATADYRGNPITFACDYSAQTNASPSYARNASGIWDIVCSSTDGTVVLILWFPGATGTTDATDGYPDGITMRLTALSSDRRLESNGTNRVENIIESTGDIHAISGTFHASWSKPPATDDGDTAFGSVSGTFNVVQPPQ
jgi:hypothetical protein